MQYFILSLSSISNSFSIFESGDKIRFKYYYAYKKIGDLNKISQNDFILGYKRGINLIKYVFKVIEINSKKEELILEKVLECNHGVTIDTEEIINQFQQQEIIKIEESYFIEIYNKLINNLNLFDKEPAPIEEPDSEPDDDLESKRISWGKNTLIYGVPGVGKSHTIKTEKCKDIDEYYIERVVFHPDYTYSDFVGQILPNVSEDKKIEYKFAAGPLTKILRKAYKNPTEKVVLIIEEINRGNAPAIFGDIFQLLDRMKKSDDGFKKGTSEFGITNSEIAKEVYDDETWKVRIPSNLAIIATMNTSDQNVFTLDTAFKRRWNMELVKNNFDEPSFKNKPIKNSKVSWKVFGTAINEIILDNANSMLSSEDKRLGAFFVDEEELESPKKFAEKVVMYLWDDVFKFNRDDYFDETAVDEFSLECFIEKFEKDTFDIFTPIITEKIEEVEERLFDGKENDSE